MRLSFSQMAVEDLIRLRKFLTDTHGDPKRVSKQFIGSIRKLLFAPQIGRWIPELPGEIRETIFGKYVVRYAIVHDNIYILRIWHVKEHRSDVPDLYDG